MRNLIIDVVMVILLQVSFAIAYTHIPAGDVFGTWTSSGSPYLIDGEITIPTDSTLTIQPGVDVIFQGHYKFIVYGFLRALGTETDSIFFTAADTTVGWHGIRFIDSPGSCFLEYCIVQFGHATGSFVDSWGGGVYCENSNPVLEHCRFYRNVSTNVGGAIACRENSNPTINECLFCNNTATNCGGAIITAYDSNPSIFQCIFSLNTAGIYGGGIYCLISDPTISFCLIIQNIADYGGGISCSHSNPFITNCTVSKDSAYYGGGIYCDYYNPIIINTILWNNSALNGPPIFVYSGWLGITYSDIQYGWIGEGNINSDPLFIDFGSGDYHLQSTSPCIDAGDPNSPHDPDGTIADMGAFYYPHSGIPNHPTSEIYPTSIILYQNYPNPFNTNTVISYYLPQRDQVTFAIYNILGQRIATLFDDIQSAGQHQAIWQAADIASGVYIARLQASSQVKNIKILLLK